MNIKQLIKLNANGAINWTSPSGPIGSDYQELFVGMDVPPTFHPPSLKLPEKLKLPTPQDGWREGDSEKSREQAAKDLKTIHDRLTRQGKPNVSQGANYPLFPNITTKL